MKTIHFFGSIIVLVFLFSKCERIDQSQNDNIHGAQSKTHTFFKEKTTVLNQYICPVPYNMRPYYLYQKITEIDSLKKRYLLHKKVENLKNIAYVPYYHREFEYIYPEDSLFWDVAIEGLEIVPYLIEKLVDTTTTPSHVFYIGGYYTVADVSLMIINEILDGIDSIVVNCVEKYYGKIDEDQGYLPYHYKFLRKDIKNRENVKIAVENWWCQNNKKLVFVENKMGRISAPKEVQAPLCGYYKVVD